MNQMRVPKTENKVNRSNDAKVEEEIIDDADADRLDLSEDWDVDKKGNDVAAFEVSDISDEGGDNSDNNMIKEMRNQNEN
jgi:hypothetical protein